jgi:Domain of unknown function (DUF4338)/DDE_Tnp_1-associated
LLGWASAAFKCAARDAWIGWSAPIQWQRISLLANNSRFLILPSPQVKNLASKILSANLVRLSADWEAIHGHPVLLAETFVDPARFAGTCYRAANWIDVGASVGFSKSNTRYTEHGQSKRILVYPLCRRARVILSSPWPHRQLPKLKVKPIELSDAQARTLLDRLSELPDARSRQGLRHRQGCVLAVAACAFISGAQSSQAMAQWAERASQPLLRRLRCRYDPNTRRHIAPGETTLRRVLDDVPVQTLESVLGNWLQTQYAPADAQDP